MRITDDQLDYLAGNMDVRNTRIYLRDLPYDPIETGIQMRKIYAMMRSIRSEGGTAMWITDRNNRAFMFSLDDVHHLAGDVHGHRRPE